MINIKISFRNYITQAQIVSKPSLSIWFYTASVHFSSVKKNKRLVDAYSRKVIKCLGRKKKMEERCMVKQNIIYRDGYVMSIKWTVLNVQKWSITKIFYTHT